MVIPRSRSALSLSKTQARRTVSVPRSYQLDVGTALTVLEGTLSEFGGFLLKLFDSTLVDTTALVDQVTSGGRFSGVDVTNDYERDQLDAGNNKSDALTDDINVNLLLTHGGCLEANGGKWSAYPSLIAVKESASGERSGRKSAVKDEYRNSPKRK